MMSKVVHMRYTSAMAIIDDIYANVDDFGLVTSAEAKEFGIPNTELVQQERRGKLVRVARGVYRMPIWPHQEAAPYAIAVKAAGEGAYLWGESVVALLGLTPTDPTRIWVASPKRIRRDVGQGVTVLGMRQGRAPHTTRACAASARPMPSAPPHRDSGASGRTRPQRRPSTRDT